MEQSDKIARLKKVVIPKEFSSQRAAAEYIGCNSLPEICANVHLIELGIDPTTIPDYKALNKIVDFLRETQND